jgi:hypothetical protein
MFFSEMEAQKNLNNIPFQEKSINIKIIIIFLPKRPHWLSSLIFLLFSLFSIWEIKKIK